jgi:hypothetical protein
MVDWMMIEGALQYGLRSDDPVHAVNESGPSCNDRSINTRERVMEGRHSSQLSGDITVPAKWSRCLLLASHISSRRTKPLAKVPRQKQRVHSRTSRITSGQRML